MGVGKKLATLSLDDGCPEDQQVAELLNGFGIPATFYLRGDRLPGLKQDWYRGHEIGSHTITHRHMYKLSDADLVHETVESRRMIQAWSGQEVVGFSYPYGQANIRAAMQVKAAGYLYGRLFNMDHDNAWIIPEPFLMPTSILLHVAEPVMRIALTNLLSADKPMHLAGHSYHYVPASQLEDLTRIAETIRVRGYRFVTNTEYFLELHGR
jgi:peptidoglycan/xylan/chitin deacetylase (PgdA/CDA1 family)